MSRYVPENVRLGSNELQKKYGLEESYRYYLDKEEKADREFKEKADPFQAAPINKGGRPKKYNNKLLEKALSMLNRNGGNKSYTEVENQLGISKSTLIREVRRGRPTVEYPSNWAEVYNSWKNKEITAVKSMSILGLKKNSFYKLVNQYEKAAQVNADLEEVEEAARNENKSKTKVNPLKSRGCEFEQTSRPTKVPCEVAKNFPTANQSQYIKSLVVSCSYYIDKIYRMKGLEPYSKIKEYDYVEYASRFKGMKRVHTCDSISEIITDLHILRDKLREITSSKAELRPLNRNEMALYMKLKARGDVPGANELNKIIRGIK